MRIAIFDLDDVLIHEGFDPPILCTETIRVLQELSNRNVQLALASYNAEADRLLQQVGIRSYFTWVVSYEDDGTHKTSQLRQLLQLIPQVSIEKFHLFDDLQENIDTARAMGMEATLVDYRTGIRMTDLL